MTPEGLRDWLDRCEQLEREMLENGDAESLMVAASMVAIRGHIAACRGEGDSSWLRELAAFCRSQSLRYIQQYTAAASRRPF